MRISESLQSAVQVLNRNSRANPQSQKQYSDSSQADLNQAGFSLLISPSVFCRCAAIEVTTHLNDVSTLKCRRGLWKFILRTSIETINIPREKRNDLDKQDFLPFNFLQKKTKMLFNPLWRRFHHRKT